MVITDTLISAVILAASGAFGSIIYMLMTDAPDKKGMLEALLSQFINMVIFIIVVKIIMNLDVFLSDPLAVLAYPGGSTAFYTALLLTAMIIVYKNFKGTMYLRGFLEALTIVFIASSMMYEFIYFIIYDDTYAFGYFIVLALIFLLVYLLYSRLKKMNLLILTVSTWSVCMIGLSAVYSTATVFGFTMEPWFTILLGAGLIILTMSAYVKTGENDKKEVDR